MKINILEDKKNRFVFEIDGIGHTFINILKNELWNDANVKVATYSIKHAEISNPKFILETDGNESPRAALASAVGRLKRLSDKFKKEVVKEIR